MRTVFLAFFLFSATQIFGQTELPDRIQSYLNKYQEDFPVEKAYLHLDKHTYTLGEDLWFSTYLVAGGTQVPSPMSKTLYVDLFDGDGLLLTQKMIQIENGRGAGDFKIPNFGKAGIYRIKAYTSWMKNFGEDYFFSQDIQVIDGSGGSFLPSVKFREIAVSEGKIRYRLSIQAVNASGEPLSNQKIQIRATGNDEILAAQEVLLNSNGEAEFGFSIPEKVYPFQRLELIYEENESYLNTQSVRLPYAFQFADIQFLPEGGNWLIGKKSRLAFRAVDPDGTPVPLSGKIEGIPNSDFTSNFAGLGKIDLTPTSESLQAIVTSSNFGEERTIPLPGPATSGLSMQVQNPEQGAFISVFVQGINFDENLLLVSHTRGIINYLIKGALANGVWGARIPKKNLPSGINSITVLDQEGKPLLERLIFVTAQDAIKLEVETNSTLDARGKVELNLSSTYNDNPIPGSFSLAVGDADQVVDESDLYGNLFSYLLLSSDLKGTIHKPGVYFKDQNPETKEALDLVMLTHGWSRFTWKNISEDTYPDQGFFIEQGISIKGKVKEQNESKKGLAGGKISAMIGEGIELITSGFGPEGSFFLTDLIYQDSVTVTLTAEDQRARSFVDIELILPEAQFKSIPGKYPIEVAWPEGLTATVSERNLMQALITDSKIIDLDGVTVGAKTLQEEETSARKLYGEGDATIKPDKIPGAVAFVSVFQMIQGRVAGVQVSYNGFSGSVLIRGSNSFQTGSEPLYLLDNVPVDAATFGQVSPRDVESIEIFKDPARTAIFGSQGSNGAVAIYTKSGAGIRYQSVGGTLVTKYGGYATPREFYSPKYDEKSPATAVTDKRATLYWNPLVKTDENGKAAFSYFNSDSAKRHLIVIEGMDSLGRLGRMVKILQ